MAEHTNPVVSEVDRYLEGIGDLHDYDSLLIAIQIPGLVAKHGIVNTDQWGKGYRLTGVVVTPTKRLVLLMPKGGSVTIGVAKGETLDDWQLTEVEREFIVLERGARKKTYIVRDSAEIENIAE